MKIRPPKPKPSISPLAWWSRGIILVVCNVLVTIALVTYLQEAFRVPGTPEPVLGSTPTNHGPRVRETGLVDVRAFGAKGDGLSDDTQAVRRALDYCRQYKRALSIPSGRYLVSNMDVSGVPKIQGEAGLYSSGTVIVHLRGATKDLITFEGNPALRPSIADLRLEGAKEVNLRNARTMTSVITRTEIVVDSAPPPNITGSICFIYSDLHRGGYRYMGTGVVSRVDGNRVFLAEKSDLYATVAEGLPLPGWKVCFAEVATEKGISAVDLSRAGYAAINLTELGGYVELRRVRIQGFHVGIRRGAANGLKTDEVFCSKMTLASLYCPFPGGSDDIIDNFYSGGGYAPQDDLLPETFTVTKGARYRNSAFGVYLRGTSVNCAMLQLYQHRVNIYCSYLRESIIDHVYANQSILENIQVWDNSIVQFGDVVARGIGLEKNRAYPVFDVKRSQVTIGQVRVEPMDSAWAKELVRSDPDSDVRIGLVHGRGGYTQFTNQPLRVKVTDPTDPRHVAGRVDFMGTDANTRVIQLPVSKRISARQDEVITSSAAKQQGAQVTRTSGSFMFTPEHVNRVIVWGRGKGKAWAVITKIIDAASVEVDRVQAVEESEFSLVAPVWFAKFSQPIDAAGTLVSAELSGPGAYRIFKGFVDQRGLQTITDSGSADKKLLVFLLTDPYHLGDQAGRRPHALALALLDDALPVPAQISGTVHIIPASYRREAVDGTVSQRGLVVTRRSGTRDFGLQDVGSMIRFSDGSHATILKVISPADVAVAEEQIIQESGYEIVDGDGFAL